MPHPPSFLIIMYPKWSISTVINKFVIFGRQPLEHGIRNWILWAHTWINYSAYWESVHVKLSSFWIISKYLNSPVQQQINQIVKREINVWINVVWLVCFQPVELFSRKYILKFCYKVKDKKKKKLFLFVRLSYWKW